MTYSSSEEWLESDNQRWSKFDRISVAACVFLGGAVLAIIASLGFWDAVFHYLVVGIAAACVAAVAAFSIRLATFGKLPPNVYELLPRRVIDAAMYWLAVKFGVLGATLYLLLAAGVGLFLHWKVGFLVQGFVLLTMAMVIGNLVQSCAVNISLAWRRRSEPQPDSDI